MNRLYYLTDAQFTQINRLLPPEDSGRGRPPKLSNRDALEMPEKGYCTSCARARRGGIYRRPLERGTPLTCAGSGGWSGASGGISSWCSSA
jgi:hypothetical protein